jgi:hypothetical protein
VVNVFRSHLEHEPRVLLHRSYTAHMTPSDPDTARILSCVHSITHLLTTSYLRRAQEPGETTGSCDARRSVRVFPPTMALYRPALLLLPTLSNIYPAESRWKRCCVEPASPRSYIAIPCCVSTSTNVCATVPIMFLLVEDFEDNHDDHVVDTRSWEDLLDVYTPVVTGSVSSIFWLFLRVEFSGRVV